MFTMTGILTPLTLNHIVNGLMRFSLSVLSISSIAKLLSIKNLELQLNPTEPTSDVVRSSNFPFITSFASSSLSKLNFNLKSRFV